MDRASEKCGTLLHSATHMYWEYQRIGEKQKMYFKKYWLTNDEFYLKH